MKIKQKIFWPCTFLLLLVLQGTLFCWIRIVGAVPNLLLLAIAFFALRRGPFIGEWLGFFLGLAADALSISLFGSQTFMYTLIGYGMGQLQGKIVAEKLLAQVTIILAVSALNLTGLVLLELLFVGTGQRFSVQTSLLNPIYSAAVAPPVFFFLERWQSLFYSVKNS